MATTTEVPGRFEVGINGRPYRIDYALAEQFRGPVSLRVARNQADTQDRPGEQSLSRENLWRRTITSWHHGCGQVIYDTEGGDPFRFYKSLGIDVWTPGRLKPLGGLARRAVPSANAGNIVGGTNTVNLMVNFNGQGYVTGNTNNATLYNTWDTSVSIGTVPNGFKSICTNGATIYAADKGGGGTGGDIHSSTGGAFASYKTGAYYLVRWALGRLWAANATTLVNVISGSDEKVAYTDTTTNWEWTDVVAGTGGVLASGFDQTHSVVVLVGLLPDGTGVTPGYVIAEMPQGEKITAMHSYLGYVILGTNKGVRVCKHDGDARFTVGPLIDLYSPEANATRRSPSTTSVRCFASFERFVYFGWSFYDWGGQTNSTENSGTHFAGLGRLDLSTMLAPLQPAYATDVMNSVTTTGGTDAGEVTGCVVDKYGIPAFVVNDYELFFGTVSGTPSKTQYANLGSGTDYYLRTGKIVLGLDDIKVLSSLAIHTDATDVSPNPITVSIATEQSPTFTSLGSITGTTSTATYDLSTISPTEAIEVRFDFGDNFSGMKAIYDLRLAAWPSPPRLERWQLPLLLHRQVETKDQGTHSYASLTAELDALRALASPTGRAIVDFQFLGQNYKVVVDDYEFIPWAEAPFSDDEYQGTVVVTLSRAVT